MPTQPMRTSNKCCCFIGLVDHTISELGLGVLCTPVFRSSVFGCSSLVCFARLCHFCMSQFQSSYLVYFVRLCLDHALNNDLTISRVRAWCVLHAYVMFICLHLECFTRLWLAVEANLALRKSPQLTSAQPI